MEAIINKISDPGWWFDAIVLVIIFGFLKDKLEQLMSKISTAYKNKKAAKMRVKQTLIDTVIANPEYLFLVLQRAQVKAIAFVLIVLLYFVAPSRALLGWGGWDNLIMLFIFFVTLFAAYKATSSVTFALDALSEYRKAKGLPKVP